MLLAKSADVNARTKKGRTGADIARKEHRIPVTRFLANLQGTAAGTVTPQDFCFYCAVLKASSADSNANKTINSTCPIEGNPDEILKKAMRDGDLEEVQSLVWRCGYDVNSRGPKDGNNGLHEAAMLGNANMTLLFLEAGQFDQGIDL